MSDRAHVVYVLLLVQVAAMLLAMLGELLFMGGNLLYVGAPLVRAAVTVVFGAMLLRSTTKVAPIAIIVLEGLTLVGFSLSGVAGLLPMVDFTPTLTGLLTGVVLPAVVIVYCGRMLWERSLTA